MDTLLVTIIFFQTASLLSYASIFSTTWRKYLRKILRAYFISVPFVCFGSFLVIIIIDGCSEMLQDDTESENWDNAVNDRFDRLFCQPFYGYFVIVFNWFHLDGLFFQNLFVMTLYLTYIQLLFYPIISPTSTLWQTLVLCCITSTIVNIIEITLAQLEKKFCKLSYMTALFQRFHLIHNVPQSTLFCETLSKINFPFSCRTFSYRTWIADNQ